MATPISVGVTAVVAALRNPDRVQVLFQNTGATTLYFYRNPNIPSTTSFEFSLAPGATPTNENSELSTNSIAQFNVISSAAGGVLAIYETARA